MFSSFCSALSVLFIPNSTSLPLDHIHQVSEWFEEQLEDDLKWSFAVNRILHAATSEFQDIVLLDTKRFGKALLLDGKLQSAEKDEFIYHESLVHPALLLHHNPKTVFIMGGGEGSTARETLKHKDIEKVVMCDIDRDVVNFCRAHLKENQDAFQDEKLHIIFDDAKAGLEGRPEKFDVIIGDLSDPHEGGPCNHLYTKSFYEEVIKPKLNDNGIFVTQAGPAGILSHEVFSSIYNTVKHVFKYVIAYTAHVPSYADSCGWVLACDHPIELDMEDLNNRIRERVRGELHYLDGAYIVSSTVVNKTIRASMMNETHLFTEEDARFAHGRGLVSDA
ncbi:thermospermine synthase ACAULIS5-like [Benincasa hispida]|uniref:thermospermine synthase ACAULIS5-like n=1 Tax=Benincasa hispida TaxID=102211 RepID=UPI0018FF20A5|nr:thermospermine synthase ACAULIS5-like [Benincasa hispida]